MGKVTNSPCCHNPQTCPICQLCTTCPTCPICPICPICPTCPICPCSGSKRPPSSITTIRTTTISIRAITCTTAKTRTNTTDSIPKTTTIPTKYFCATTKTTTTISTKQFWTRVCPSSTSTGTFAICCISWICLKYQFEHRNLLNFLLRFDE